MEEVVIVIVVVTVVDDVWRAEVRRERERRGRKGGESWRLARRNERQPGAACVPIRSDALFITPLLPPPFV